MSHNHTTNYDGANNRNGIPQNLIKNFNIYEVLEPIKVNKLKEDTLLIDLGESSQVRNEISDSRPTRSTQEENDGFSMIDLYQNIYVTPELVSKPIEKPVSNNQTTNVDYEEFLRKLDMKKKFNSIPEPSLDKKSYKTHQAELEQTFDNLGYKEHRSMTNNGVYHNFDSSDPAEHEKLIDELLDRSLSALKISKATDVAGKARVLKTPNLTNNTRNESFVLHKDNMKSVHNVASTRQVLYVNDDGLLKEAFILPQASITREPVTINSESKLNDNLVSGFLKAMECKDIKLKTAQDQPANHTSTNAGLQSSLPFSARYDGPNLSTLLLNNDKLAKWKTTVKNANINDSKFNNDTFELIKTTTDPEIMSVMPVKAVIKDNKAFAKKLRITSDSEKRNYTKGPDLNEKRVVIPQILDRLGLEKKVYTNKKNFQRRLILDAGSKQSGKSNGKCIEIPVTLEPTTLMEDCNMERLKAFRTRQKFDNFVNGSILP